MESLEEFFRNRIIRVPDFQRRYSWEPKNITQFCGDVEKVIEGGNHLLGTIMLYPGNGRYIGVETATHPHFHYVVDGNQRLTTCAILLRVLMDYPNLADQQRERIRRLVFADPQVFRFDDEVEEYSVSAMFSDAPSGNIVQKRLRKAKWELEQLILSHAANLEDVVNRVLDNIHLSCVLLSDQYDPATVFETLNNRGRPLSKMSLLKARLDILTSGMQHNNMPLDHAEIIEKRIRISNVWQEVDNELNGATEEREEQVNEDEFLKVYSLARLANEQYGREEINQVIENLFAKTFRIGITSWTPVESFVSKMRSAAREYWRTMTLSANLIDLDEQLYPRVYRFGVYHHHLVRSPFEPLILALLINESIPSSEKCNILDLVEKHDVLCYALNGRNVSLDRTKATQLVGRIRNYEPENVQSVVESIGEMLGGYSAQSINRTFNEVARLVRDSEVGNGFAAYKWTKYLLFAVAAKDNVALWPTYRNVVLRRADAFNMAANITDPSMKQLGFLYLSNTNERIASTTREVKERSDRLRIALSEMYLPGV